MTAVGTPVTRVDGPAKVTGAARYSAEIALPGIDLPGDRRRDRSPSGRVDGDRRRRGARRRRRAGRPHPRATCRRSPPSRTCCRRWSAVAAPGESFFPMQDDVVHYAGQPVALVVAEELRAGRSTPRRWCGVSYETAPSVTTIDQGRDQAYEAERLFGGLMPGAQRARRRRGRAWRRPTCASRPPTGWRPTTTTRSRRRRRSPSGRAAG